MQVVLAMAIGLVTLPVLLNGVLYLGRWWILRGQADSEERLPLPQRIAAFGSESVAVATTMVGVFVPRPRPSNEGPGERDVAVLVPGFGFPTPAFSPLARRLERDGWRVIAAPSSPWRLDFTAAARSLDEALRSARSEIPRITLIGFGTGGLVARRYLCSDGAIPVRQLITLGCPHQGTEAPWFQIGSLRRLRPDSVDIRELVDNDALPQRVDVIAIYSDFDAVVVPTTRAYYPGAFNIEVRGVGHFSLARSERVWQLIAENLRAANPMRERKSH